MNCVLLHFHGSSHLHWSSRDKHFGIVNCCDISHDNCSEIENDIYIFRFLIFFFSNSYDLLHYYHLFAANLNSWYIMLTGTVRSIFRSIIILNVNSFWKFMMCQPWSFTWLPVLVSLHNTIPFTVITTATAFESSRVSFYHQGYFILCECIISLRSTWWPIVVLKAELTLFCTCVGELMKPNILKIMAKKMELSIQMVQSNQSKSVVGADMHAELYMHYKTREMFSIRLEIFCLDQSLILAMEWRQMVFLWSMVEYACFMFPEVVLFHFEVVHC